MIFFYLLSIKYCKTICAMRFTDKGIIKNLNDANYFQRFTGLQAKFFYKDSNLPTALT